VYEYEAYGDIKRLCAARTEEARPARCVNDKKEECSRKRREK